MWLVLYYAIKIVRNNSRTIQIFKGILLIIIIDAIAKFLGLKTLAYLTDMTGAKPGLQDFTLQVDQPSGGLVKYSLVSNTYTLNVLGETNSDTTETNSGTGTE